jgi:hypothetical protein
MLISHLPQPFDFSRRRFDRVGIGFWLGGIALGTVGFIVGACMPYRHPAGVTISVLWWGIYLGCFGASIGAGIGCLFGLWRDHTPAFPSHGGISGRDNAACRPAITTAIFLAADGFPAGGNVFLATHNRSGESGWMETPA